MGYTLVPTDKKTTLMRTSTRRARLREPVYRWKTGGSADAEWTSELQGEGESRSPRRNRHRYQAGGRSEKIRAPQRVRLANQTLHIHAGFCVSQKGRTWVAPRA